MLGYTLSGNAVAVRKVFAVFLFAGYAVKKWKSNHLKFGFDANTAEPGKSLKT